MVRSDLARRYSATDVVEGLPPSIPEAPASRKARSPRPAPRNRDQGAPADIEAIRNGCSWMNHCYEDRASLPEPEWYAALSIVGRCSTPGADSRQLAHAWSEGHRRYSARETDLKLEHALADAGPRTCEQIGQELGAWEPYCSRCIHRGKIKSPIVLGRKDSDRAVVIVDNDEARMNDEALGALSGHPAVYHRGGVLVQVISGKKAHQRIVRPLGAPRIAPIQEATLREMLSEVVDFQKWTSKDEPTLRKVNPPQQCYRALLQRGQWPELRRLEGVSESPFLRLDGTVCQQPGYDEASGLLFLPNADYPEVPKNPTTDQVKAAIDSLREPVIDFPFHRPEHRAAWIASLLTPLARHAFEGPAPLNFIDANTAASGKGLLVSVTSWIASGREIARMAYSANEEEQRKAILAMAIEALPTVLIDNVPGSFGSAVIDAALTATEWRDRLLGANRLATAPLTTVWYATGNNVSLDADTARRCLVVRLETPLANPEERTGFRYPDLLQWVRRHRARLAVSALTLLRAYCAAKRPDQHLAPWGSFEEWSDLIRGTVVWAGLPDPGATRIELRQLPGSRQAALGHLVAGLEEVFAAMSGACGTTREVIQKLKSAEGSHIALREALDQLIARPQGDQGLPTAPQLAALLRNSKGRVVDGKAIDAPADRTKRGTLWCVRATEAGGSDASNGAGGAGGAVDSRYAEKNLGTAGAVEKEKRTEGGTTAPIAPPALGELERWQI